MDRLRAGRQLNVDADTLPMVRLMLTIAARGEAVIVGRGAGFLLPPATTLHVRVVAPAETRAASLAEALRLTHAEARAEIHARDEMRTHFLDRTFRRTPADSYGYDLIVNSARLGIDGAARVVAEAIRHKHLAPRPSRPTTRFRTPMAEPAPPADSYPAFAAAARAASPRTAVVLGSGLAGVTAGVREIASVGYADVPGMVPTTVHGHRGRLVLGDWGGVPVLIAFGRLHFYEGHTWDAVTGLVRAVAALGARRLVLTNAAGGIHPALAPGSLMALRGHVKLIGPDAWRGLAAGAEPAAPYSSTLLERLRKHEAATGRELVEGVYAALTGPSYETVAEIRALQACGVDAVGMSTAAEAEAAAALGMEVAAISCITNRAAGLGDGPLDHKEVLDNAQLAVERLAGMGERLSCW